jgi:hypothetical protein
LHFSLLWVDNAVVFSTCSMLLLAILLLLGSAVVDISFIPCVSTGVGIDSLVGVPAMLLDGFLLLPAVVDILSVPGISAFVAVPSVVDIPDMAGVPSIFSTHAVVSFLMLLRS